MRVTFSVNGLQREVDVPVAARLLDTLRDLGLTGTKEGCGTGVCGVCSVLVGDRPVSSCSFLTACADGLEVWTVEGIAAIEPDLVEAFVVHEAMQCGICTPGLVVMVAALERLMVQYGQTSEALDDEVLASYLSGNLCRCTGYQAILTVARARLADVESSRTGGSAPLDDQCSIPGHG